MLLSAGSPVSDTVTRDKLVGCHLEFLKEMRPEGVNHRDVRRVSSPGDQDAANPRYVVPRVESIPTAVEIGL